jgi:hypothetical protein
MSIHHCYFFTPVSNSGFVPCSQRRHMMKFRYFLKFVQPCFLASSILKSVICVDKKNMCSAIIK